MAIRIACPGCSTSYVLGDEVRGGQFICKKCKTAMRIPAPAKSTPAKTVPAKPANEGIREQPSRKAPPPTRRDAVQAREVRPRGRDFDDEDRPARRRDRDEEDDRPRRSARERKKGGLPMGFWIGGGIGAGVLVIGAVVAIVLLTGDKTPDKLAKNDKPANQDAGQKGGPNPDGNKPDPIKDQDKKENPKPDKLADALTGEHIQRVKQATAYLKVTTPTGMMAEGSGFLAIEPGIVITNAHVLGMLSPNSRPPRQDDVVLHSGEPNRLELVGEVLGVDRSNDLAVVKVHGNLPAPLQLEQNHKLIETQKVYIFGFPFGRELGANITVSESSVSSLRKTPGGEAIEKIQVNGGMHPGNSGGPVVNANGQLVGVSVAGIRGTTINFAIPADFVKQLLAGRVLEGKFSEPYIKDGQPVLPVKYMCLDPFNRIKEVKVEVWTGNAGPERPFALETPTPRPGDGPRQTHTISYNNAVAQGEVPLPALGPGQVVWLQPVLVHGVGNSQWGPGLASEADLIALERKPANLLLNQTAHKLRTAHLKLSMGNTLIRGKEKQTSADRAELDFLEAIYAVPKGIAAKLSFGPPVVSYEEDGRKLPMDPAVPDLLRRIPPTFVINPANRMMERGAINLSPKLHPKIREYTNDYFNEICNAYEATTLVMPNRELQPLETWDAVVTMLMKQERKVEPADLVLACTYEGTRSRKGRAEALITVVGQVKGRGANQNKMDGKVNGRFAFDLGDGYISLAKVSIVSEADILGGALQLTNAFEMDLSRAPGNPLNLEVPKQGEQPKELPPIKGTVVFQIPNGVLNNADSFDPDPKHKGSRAKLIQVKLQKDKTYAIQLNSNQFDPYLRLMDPKGNTIAIDDDSGGNLNARIDIKAPVTGVYGIVVTTFDRKIGDFQLIVTQLQP